MLFLKRLFQAPRFEAEARALYRRIAERARRPILFMLYGVPDTIDGRFEMLCLHTYALFHGLKGKGADAEAFTQAANNAKTGCPVSKVLKAEITMDAVLET